MTVTTDPRKTGIAAGMSLLDASAVAVILPSSGSSNATGQITLTTALPSTPVGTVGVYLPAGVVTAGSQGSGAGVYQATFSSTTVCQLTGTGIVTANAAYTQSTSEVTLATTTVPGGAMGLNGGIEARTTWTFPNNANTKTLRERFGGAAGTQYLTSAQTTQVCLRDARSIRNRNSASAQLGSTSVTAGNSFASSGVAPVTSSVDTTAAVDLVFTGQLGVATDYIILEGRETWLLP